MRGVWLARNRFGGEIFSFTILPQRRALSPAAYHFAGRCY